MGWSTQGVGHSVHLGLVHSATRWAGGHGTTIGGVVISRGRSCNYRVCGAWLTIFLGKFYFTRDKLHSWNRRRVSMVLNSPGVWTSGVCGETAKGDSP